MDQPHNGDNFARSATIGCTGGGVNNGAVTVKMYSGTTIVASQSTTVQNGVWIANLSPSPTWPCGNYTIKLFAGAGTDPVASVDITVSDSGCCCGHLLLEPSMEQSFVRAEDGWAEDGRAEDGRAEDGRAEDGRAEQFALPKQSPPVST